MVEIRKWKVLRRHEGDRMYEESETREGTRAELGHLSPHVLEDIGPADEPDEKAEAEAAPQNKAEGASPADKADNRRKAKGK